MIIHLLIAALGLNIQFTDVSPRGEFVCGTTYYDENRIVLTMNSYCNTDESLYHEIGHMLFLHDEEVVNLISKYPPPRPYPSKYYPTDKQKLNERVADYFLMYIKYPDFATKFPEIKKMFDKKTNDYLEK